MRMIIFSGIWISATLYGDIVIKQTAYEGKKQVPITIYATPKNLRIEHSAAKEPTVMLFDAKKQTITILQPAQKRYFKVTKKELTTFNNLSNIAGRYESMIKAQLKRLAPNQRKKAEIALAKMTQKKVKPEKLHFRASKVGKVGSWPCKNYKIFAGKKLVYEVCSADFKALGITPQISASLTRWQKC